MIILQEILLVIVCIGQDHTQVFHINLGSERRAIQHPHHTAQNHEKDVFVQQNKQFYNFIDPFG